MAEQQGPTYEWEVVVWKRDIYGSGRTIAEYPATIIAPTADEAEAKAREAFGAKHDPLRKSWSHFVEIKRVTEVVHPVCSHYGQTLSDRYCPDCGEELGS